MNKMILNGRVGQVRPTVCPTLQFTDAAREKYKGAARNFLAEMQKRLELLGYASEERYAMPLTQELVADTLGLSVVHVNRTLKTLRKRGLVTIADREVHILAPERLREQAEFDTSYLRQRPASPKALARAAIDPR